MAICCSGVHFYGNGATTHSIIMRGMTGTIRRMEAHHRLKASSHTGFATWPTGAVRPASNPTITMTLSVKEDRL